MEEVVAEKEIFSISAQGGKRKIHISVGKPYRVDDVSWACPLEMKGLHKKLPDMVGVDSWQALQLAMALVRQFLSYFVEDGGKLFWEEGGKDISLGDLFQ